MGLIDSTVRAVGRDVTLERVVDPQYNELDDFDEEASTIERVTVKAVIGPLTERDQRRVEGRVPDAELKATLESDVDVDHNRPGRPDRLIVDGVTYRIASTLVAQHPFADSSKLSVVLDDLPGR